MKAIRCLSQKSCIIHGFRLNNLRFQLLVVTLVTGFLCSLHLLMESISNPTKRPQHSKKRGSGGFNTITILHPKLSCNCMLNFCSHILILSCALMHISPRDVRRAYACLFLQDLWDFLWRFSHSRSG